MRNDFYPLKQCNGHNFNMVYIFLYKLAQDKLDSWFRHLLTDHIKSKGLIKGLKIWSPIKPVITYGPYYMGHHNDPKLNFSHPWAAKKCA